MDPITFFPKESLWQEDAFRFVKPDEFEALGIDPADVPLGTFPALKHPAQLESRFGGNAYGFGLFEFHDRLGPKELKLIQSIHFEDPAEIRTHYKKLNEMYKRIGLLIRFTSQGRPYYLIPGHLVSNTLTHIKAKVDEIAKIIGFHRKKYFKEYHDIGIVTHQDDLITHELSLRFKEHRFRVIDSLDKLRLPGETLDLVVITWDPYEIMLMEKFSPLSREEVNKRRLDQYFAYMLHRIYKLLKPDGEIFIIANHHVPRSSRTTKIGFKTHEEEKNFLLFSHIFKTRKKYRTKNHALDVNIFDFQKYLGGLYVEQEVVDKILKGRNLEDLSPQGMNKLPYLNNDLSDWPLLREQERNWARLLSAYYDKIFLKPLVPPYVKRDWDKRFDAHDYEPAYMLIYLGQKKPLSTTLSALLEDTEESELMGCPVGLMADYRDSFDYVIRTLGVLNKLKDGFYETLPQLSVDRLKQPLENKRRRFSALTHVIKLMSKTGRLERIRDQLNPDGIEGSKTKIIENLEILPFHGFSREELREILLIVLGHTPLGRIISGKMNEKALKPVSDLARRYEPQQALNLLRYCRLMTMAEKEAAAGSELSQEETAELFDLYESAVKVVTMGELDWEQLLDEKITRMGGIHNKIIRRLLKMMNYFEFLDNWVDLSRKGQMAKEALADYDEEKLARINNVIKLVDTIEQLEKMYLGSVPLQIPAFYRKFMEMEFHGTFHLFERMDSEIVFILLWITVTICQGDIINFNPILAHVEPEERDRRVRKVEQNAKAINIRYLDHATLKQLSRQVYAGHPAFIVGTGFRLRVAPETQSLEIAFIDVERDIRQLEALAEKLAGCRISEIPLEDLREFEGLFSDLEDFYQSHLHSLEQTDATLRLPTRQRNWFERVRKLRERLKSNFQKVIFRPEALYTDLDLLYHHARSLLNFVLPEVKALQDLDMSPHLYLRSPVILYIFASARKLQALILRDRESFQDRRYLHQLAQKEFGPMTAGIIGANEDQIEVLETILEALKQNTSLFDALIKAFILQDLGRATRLREKYAKEINPADLAQAGALFIEKEGLDKVYHLDRKGRNYLIFLVRHHGLMHHIIRGEMAFSALQETLEPGDKELFDAFFLFSFIMLSALREDLILEDLADRLLAIREMCHRIIVGETSLQEQLDLMCLLRGRLFHALEAYQKHGLPKGVKPADYLKSSTREDIKDSQAIRAGRMLFAMERLFRLQGIRYVLFRDLGNHMLKVPLKYIYRKRRFASIGYATFEKELFEALRIYNTFQQLEEDIRHFLLDKLIGDKVRIYGYEKVSGYLTYKNRVKLLLAALLGTRRFKPKGAPISMDFLGLGRQIERRYEAVNESLNMLSVEKLWKNRRQLDALFKAKTGVFLRKERFPNVLSIDFQDRINIHQKISHMDTVSNVEQLKNYFHYSLRSLRKHPFYTEDYERLLEQAFEHRLTQITDTILSQSEKQMALIKDFDELHNLVYDLLERSYDLGFSDDQRHRLNDLYELRKDSLMREKLEEIEEILETVQDAEELQDRWESIKWYLQGNRRFFGKEFENLIAKRFDQVRARLAGP